MPQAAVASHHSNAADKKGKFASFPREIECSSADGCVGVHPPASDVKSPQNPMDNPQRRASPGYIETTCLEYPDSYTSPKGVYII